MRSLLGSISHLPLYSVGRNNVSFNHTYTIHTFYDKENNNLNATNDKYAHLSTRGICLCVVGLTAVHDVCVCVTDTF